MFLNVFSRLIFSNVLQESMSPVLWRLHNFLSVITSDKAALRFVELIDHMFNWDTFALPRYENNQAYRIEEYWNSMQLYSESLQIQIFFVLWFYLTNLANYIHKYCCFQAETQNQLWLLIRCQYIVPVPCHWRLKPGNANHFVSIVHEYRNFCK